MVKSLQQGDVTVIFQHWIKRRGEVCTDPVPAAP
jgi:hypothetical protein